jgi:acetolactate synthase-1/2/3 large subunit
MTDTPAPPRAASAAVRLVETLVLNGVDHVFCVPGESYLAVLDALADVTDRIRVIACRHEAAAANMAEAYGKLTGKPGICMVTRGPGATHASAGVHTAQQDSTPMILFVGQVAAADKGRGAFQEVDYRAVFGPLAKHADELDEPGRTAEIVGRAFATALQGRQGPVVLALPEDKLHEDGGPPAPKPVTPARAGLDPEALQAIGERLRAAERPLLLLGGSGWSGAALAALPAWVQAHDLPVLLSFRRKDLLDNDHPCFAGDLAWAQIPSWWRGSVRRPDPGDRGAAGREPDPGLRPFTAADTAARLIHIHPGPEEIGRTWPPLIGAVADVAPAALALSSLELSRRWTDWRDAAREDIDAFTRPIPVADPVNLSEVVAQMTEAPARGRHPLQRRGQLRRLAAPLPPAPGLADPAGPDLRGHGLRLSGRHRRQAGRTRT